MVITETIKRYEYSKVEHAEIEAALKVVKAEL